MDCLFFLMAPISRVANMNMCIKGETVFVPDLLLVFFYTLVFLTDHILDRVFIFYLIFNNEEKTLILVFITSASIILIPLFMQLAYQKLSPKSQFYIYALSIGLAFFGLDSIYLGIEALRGVIDSEKTLNSPKIKNSIHMSDVKFFILKSYCYVTILIKTIPQLMWMPIFLVDVNFDEIERRLAFSSIMVNVLILSLTISLNFPVRKSKVVFKNCVPFVVRTFSKFMATFCASCVHLIVFTEVYRHIQFKVFLVLMPKFLVWLYPAYRNIVTQSLHLSNLVFVHGPCLALISSFIYIHPFHGTGAFFYYAFNLLSFLVEIISINAFSDTNGELTVVYFSLRILVHGYLSCFRIIDDLFTQKDVESDGEGKNSSTQDETPV